MLLQSMLSMKRADDDGFVVWDCCRFLGDNAQLKTLKGVGHVPPFAKGIGLANMIVKFLKN
jgi:hypothetical protein